MVTTRQEKNKVFQLKLFTFFIQQCADVIYCCVSFKRSCELIYFFFNQLLTIKNNPQGYYIGVEEMIQLYLDIVDTQTQYLNSGRDCEKNNIKKT